MPVSVRDSSFESFYDYPSSPRAHASLSTDEDFDYGEFVDLDQPHQPIRMNSESDVSRSATLERGPLAESQENIRQTPSSRPISSAPLLSSDNGVLGDMQIDNEQQENEKERNENTGSGDVFEALDSIERVRIRAVCTSSRTPKDPRDCRVTNG